jgi:glyoxylase-like metal-dependent hydrolase (beta-lactamase superfamily II)
MKKLIIVFLVLICFAACKTVTKKNKAGQDHAKAKNTEKIQITKLGYGIFEVRLDFVNVHVIESKKDGLIVIDSGFPENVKGSNILLEGIRELGKDPRDVKHILISHAHPDHLGNAAELQQISGAQIWMSETDAPILEDKGTDYRAIYKKDGSRYTGMPSIQKAQIAHKTKDGELIPLAGGILVIATPGHSLGHQAYLLQQHGGILFVGDAVTNVNGKMDLPPNFEDVKTEIQSIHKLETYTFDKIAFCHGDYIGRNGQDIFFKRWNGTTYQDLKNNYGIPKQ